MDLSPSSAAAVPITSLDIFKRLEEIFTVMQVQIKYSANADAIDCVNNALSNITAMITFNMGNKCGDCLLTLVEDDLAKTAPETRATFDRNIGAFDWFIDHSLMMIVTLIMWFNSNNTVCYQNSLCKLLASAKKLHNMIVVTGSFVPPRQIGVPDTRAKRPRLSDGGRSWPNNIELSVRSITIADNVAHAIRLQHPTTTPANVTMEWAGAQLLLRAKNAESCPQKPKIPHGLPASLVVNSGGQKIDNMPQLLNAQSIPPPLLAIESEK